MRRIPCKDNISNENHRVEHILSREKHPDKRLDYKNMVICCPGHIGEENHCDRLKGDRDISFNLFDENFIRTLSYKSDGKIISSNVTFDNEINEVLNLNTSLLKANRKEIWRVVTRKLNTLKGDKPWNKTILKKCLEKYSNKHEKDGKMQFIPYCGIVIYNIQKKLRQMG